MKKVIAMMMLAALMVGCSQKPKSPVEARFERYIQTEGLSQNFVQVDSIVDMDSVNLIAYYKKIVAFNDSTHDALMAEIQDKTQNMPKINPNKIEDAISIAERVSKLPSYVESAEEYRDKISIFLEDIPQEKSWYKTYTIVAKFKDGQRIYYANNIAFQDTITISTDSVDGLLTDKARRISRYFDSYLLESAAKQKVLLEDIKQLGK